MEDQFKPAGATSFMLTPATLQGDRTKRYESLPHMIVAEVQSASAVFFVKWKWEIQL
jgi:hypothetical protein